MYEEIELVETNNLMSSSFGYIDHCVYNSTRKASRHHKSYPTTRIACYSSRYRNLRSATILTVAASSKWGNQASGMSKAQNEDELGCIGQGAVLRRRALLGW